MENLTKNKVIHVYVIWGGRKGTPPFILNLRARYPLNRWLCGPPPQEKAWTFRRREKSLDLARNRSPGIPARSPVCTPTAV